jgi:hypothetical protein
VPGSTEPVEESIEQWPRVDLPGNSFVVPRVCPNCMAPANNEWETRYTRRPIGGHESLTLTFYYCDACNELFRRVLPVEDRLRMLKEDFVGGLGGIGIASAILVAFTANSSRDFVLVSPLLAGSAAAIWWWRRYRRRHQAMWEAERPPLPPNALGYGFAAYCIQARGFVNRKATFAARRREWLQALVAANAGR